MMSLPCKCPSMHSQVSPYPEHIHTPTQRKTQALAFEFPPTGTFRRCYQQVCPHFEWIYKIKTISLHHQKLKVLQA